VIQVIKCGVYVYTLIANDSLYAVIPVSSVMLRMSLLFSILKYKDPILRKEPGITHKHGILVLWLDS